jgi:predicted DNA-binding protein with PD1-like motif
MKTLPVRLFPGEDLRRALEAAATAHGIEAAFVLSGIGSLCDARLRFAGAAEPHAIAGDLEILTLSGTIAGAASHLHATLSDAGGAVVGGHVAYGCTIRTTAEVLLAPLDEWRFTREPDPATGYAELAMYPRTRPGST